MKISIYNKVCTDYELRKMVMESLAYSPETGLFTWLHDGGNQWIIKGRIAGSLTPFGYIIIGFNQRMILAHQLAFLYREGYFPENDIDHINRIKDDNRWVNLREVSRSCNMRNRNIMKNNTSGVIGVSWDEFNSSWRASIAFSGKQKQIGRYKKLNDAVKARWDSEVEYDYPTCNTTSSAYKFLIQEGLIDG